MPKDLALKYNMLKYLSIYTKNVNKKKEKKENKLRILHVPVEGARLWLTSIRMRRREIIITAM